MAKKENVERILIKQFYRRFKCKFNENRNNLKKKTR